MTIYTTHDLGFVGHFKIHFFFSFAYQTKDENHLIDSRSNFVHIIHYQTQKL